MFKQTFSGSIKEVHFSTQNKLNPIQAKEFAMSKLRNEGYKNCTISKVFVNDCLILENITVSDINF